MLDVEKLIERLRESNTLVANTVAQRTFDLWKIIKNRGCDRDTYITNRALFITNINCCLTMTKVYYKISKHYVDKLVGRE
jgi:membrane glycosyltransferase